MDENPYESPQEKPHAIARQSLARRGIRLILFGSATAIGFIAVLMLIAGGRWLVIRFLGRREPMMLTGDREVGLSVALLSGSAILIIAMTGLILFARRVGRRTP